MIIYLVNSDNGPVAAYENREYAAEEAAKGIVIDSYGAYTEQDIPAIKSDIKTGYQGYSYWIEAIELRTETVAYERSKVQCI